MVDMPYPYNAIFRRGLLNTFETALHSAYLYLKVPATFDIISIFGSQQEAKNIEKGFTQGHKNVHFFVRAVRPARGRTSRRIQKHHRGRRRVQESTIGPESPEQNHMHRHGGKSGRVDEATKFP
jgi:hypothetical protein